MDPRERQRLAAKLLTLGTVGQSSPMPGPMSMAPQPGPQLPPFTGLHNTNALPSFEQPGGSLPMQNYPNQPSPTMPPAPAPASMAPTAAAPAQQPWQTLGDQSRTAAFDPVRDAADPGNVNVVDQSGAVNPQMSPGAGALPDVAAAIAMLVKQGKLGPEWAR